MYITTTIWFMEVFIFHNPEYEGAGGEAGRRSLSYYQFLGALLSSILATVLGITKFLKHGPIFILPASGSLIKTVFTFSSVLSRNFVILIFLQILLKDQSAEKLPFSLVGTAGKHERKTFNNS